MAFIFNFIDEGSSYKWIKYEWNKVSKSFLKMSKIWTDWFGTTYTYVQKYVLWHLRSLFFCSSLFVRDLGTLVILGASKTFWQLQWKEWFIYLRIFKWKLQGTIWFVVPYCSTYVVASSFNKAKLFSISDKPTLDWACNKPLHPSILDWIRPAFVQKLF
jgi:hypothetical protein